MVVKCDATIFKEHDRRRPGLSDAPVDMEHDNNRTREKWNEQRNDKFKLFTFRSRTAPNRYRTRSV
jgi:hypothetical protein